MTLQGITWLDMALYGTTRHNVTPNDTTKVTGRSTRESSVDAALVGRPEKCRSIHESSIVMEVIARLDSHRLTRGPSVDAGVVVRHGTCRSTRGLSVYK